MIDVWNVAANSLWVLGLSGLLAVASWVSWRASERHIRFREVWQQPSIQRVVDVSLAAVCAGLAATGRAWWERVIWAALGVAFVVQAWLEGRGGKAKGVDKSDGAA